MITANSKIIDAGGHNSQYHIIKL